MLGVAMILGTGCLGNGGEGEWQHEQLQQEELGGSASWRGGNQAGCVAGVIPLFWGGGGGLGLRVAV